MLRTEYVLLTLATLWSVLHGAVPAFRDDLWLQIMDLFWPLSMLGMFVIGVKIVFAGRWKGLARVWPSVASSRPRPRSGACSRPTSPRTGSSCPGRRS